MQAGTRKLLQDDPAKCVEPRDIFQEDKQAQVKK